MSTWRPVPGYVGFYEVSDEGQVRSLDRDRTTGGTIKGRTLKVGSNTKGYRIAILCVDGMRKGHSVHRLVAEAFLGPMPDGWHTCHRDGNKTNNRLSNLYYGTPSQNELDKVRQGKNPNANKTHCPSGHEYTAANTLFQKGRSGRKCKTCHRERTAAYRTQSKEIAS